MISLIYLLVLSSLWTNINHYFITFNRWSLIFWGVKMCALTTASFCVFCRRCHWHPAAWRSEGPRFLPAWLAQGQTYTDTGRRFLGRSRQLGLSGKSKMPAYRLRAPSVGKEKGGVGEEVVPWSSVSRYSAVREGGKRQVVAHDGTIGLPRWGLTGRSAQAIREAYLRAHWLADEERILSAGFPQLNRDHSQVKGRCSADRPAAILMPATWARAVLPCTSTLGHTGGERSRTEPHFTRSPSWFPSLATPPLLICSPALFIPVSLYAAWLRRHCVADLGSVFVTKIA